MRMTTEDACKILDVQATASFEEVLAAKNTKLVAAGGDENRVVEVETAYDILFMRSMKKRMSGEIEVSTSVRYADVPPAPPRRGAGASSKSNAASSPMSKLSAPKMPAVGGIGIEAPRNQQQALVTAGIFTGLGTWALAQALLESPDAQMADTAGLQMAMALGYTAYSLKENKRMDLGKAAGLTVGVLFAGALLGTAVQSWLRVDIVPLGSFSSPGVFVTEVIIFLLALAALFLA